MSPHKYPISFVQTGEHTGAPPSIAQTISPLPLRSLYNSLSASLRFLIQLLIMFVSKESFVFSALQWHHYRLQSHRFGLLSIVIAFYMPCPISNGAIMVVCFPLLCNNFLPSVASCA